MIKNIIISTTAMTVNNLATTIPTILPLVKYLLFLSSWELFPDDELCPGLLGDDGEIEEGGGGAGDVSNWLPPYLSI